MSIEEAEIESFELEDWQKLIQEFENVLGSELVNEIISNRTEIIKLSNTLFQLGDNATDEMWLKEIQKYPILINLNNKINRKIKEYKNQHPGLFESIKEIQTKKSTKKYKKTQNSQNSQNSKPWMGGKTYKTKIRSKNKSRNKSRNKTRNRKKYKKYEGGVFLEVIGFLAAVVGAPVLGISLGICVNYAFYQACLIWNKRYNLDKQIFSEVIEPNSNSNSNEEKLDSSEQFILGKCKVFFNNLKYLFNIPNKIRQCLKKRNNSKVYVSTNDSNYLETSEQLPSVETSEPPPVNTSEPPSAKNVALNVEILPAESTKITKPKNKSPFDIIKKYANGARK